MFVTIFFICFGLIFLAELGDKTQLMVFTLALRYGGKPVFAGSFLAFALLSGIAAIIGKGLGDLFSPDLITRISAWIFIVFGTYMLTRKAKVGDSASPKASDGGAGLIAAFSLIAISEMGDKTQIATLLLSVKYQSFFPVFLGSLMALSLASFMGIFAADKLHKFIPTKYISPASGLLFIILGIGTLILA